MRNQLIVYQIKPSLYVDRGKKQELLQLLLTRYRIVQTISCSFHMRVVGNDLYKGAEVIGVLNI